MIVILLSSFNPSTADLDKARESEQVLCAQALAKCAHVVHSIRPSYVSTCPAQLHLLCHADTVRRRSTMTTMPTPTPTSTRTPRTVTQLVRSKRSLFVFCSKLDGSTGRDVRRGAHRVVHGRLCFDQQCRIGIRKSDVQC